MTEPRVIGEFTDYTGLQLALRACHALRNISFEVLDECTGAPRGYFSKVLAPGSQRRITMGSLGWALGGLGVKCIVVEDTDALRRIENFMAKNSLGKRNGNLVHGGSFKFEVSRRFMKHIQRKGGKARWAKLTAVERSELARTLNRTRWSKIKSATRRAKNRKPSNGTKARHLGAPALSRDGRTTDSATLRKSAAD